MTHINYGHKFVLDFETFNDLALAAGFKKVAQVEVAQLGDTALQQFFAKKEAGYWLETEIWVAHK